MVGEPPAAATLDPKPDPSLSPDADSSATRRTERRVELVAEEHRFLTVRRWMIVPTVFGEEANGIRIYVEVADPLDRETCGDCE